MHPEIVRDDAGRGRLVPFRDAQAIAVAVTGLLRDEPLRHTLRRNAYKLGRDMVWSRVAQLYSKSFEQARQDHSFVGRKSSPIKTLDEQPGQLPELKLDHLFRMSDSTGIFQHASFTVPNFAEGYCTDDNDRALVLALMLQKLGHGSPRLGAQAATYAAFLNHVFDRERGRFHNFMSFERRWLEEVGSEDCQGHALWALGLCVAQGGQGSFEMLAAQLFEQALPVAAGFTSPRAWAFTLIGNQPDGAEYKAEGRILVKDGGNTLIFEGPGGTVKGEKMLDLHDVYRRASK